MRNHDRLEDAFAEGIGPPERPGPGATRVDLARLALAVGSVATVDWPGDVVCDEDGVPVSIGPRRTVPAVLAGLVLSRADVERTGLPIEEVPHVRVV